MDAVHIIVPEQTAFAGKKLQYERGLKAVEPLPREVMELYQACVDVHPL